MIQERIVTVFGGTGFLGRAVVHLLARRGYQIRVPSRTPEKATPLKVMGAPGQVVVFPASLRLDTEVAAAMRDSHAVVNLIGQIGETKKDSFQTAHVELAARIARLAKAEGAEKLIHISALGAERAAPSAYARTKAFGEEAVRAFFPKATILRPSLLFGPDDLFLGRFARLSRFAPALPLIGGGVTRFQPLYVGDAAKAVATLIDAPGAAPALFCLGGPRIWRLKDALEALLASQNRRRLLLSLSWPAAQTLAACLERLPGAPLTRDQVALLKQDFIVPPGANTLASLGIVGEPLEAHFGDYLR